MSLTSYPPNEILNTPFTPQEIIEALAKLEKKKIGGSDLIKNKFLKNSRHKFAPYYTEYLT